MQAVGDMGCAGCGGDDLCRPGGGDLWETGGEVPYAGCGEMACGSLKGRCPVRAVGEMACGSLTFSMVSCMCLLGYAVLRMLVHSPTVFCS